MRHPRLLPRRLRDAFPHRGGAPRRPGEAADLRQRGQILALFALMLLSLIGIVGLAIDVTYAWREELRIQRAADAGALAGVVYLPGNLTLGRQASKDEATKNGYTTGTLNGITTSVAADQDGSNPRQMDVTITTQVNTFFSNIFGVNHFTVSRTGKAIYVLPVPMGSPLNYYGVYQLCSVTDTCVAQSNPPSGSVASQGFFGAIEGEGSNRSTGDAFAPYWNPNPTVNAQYNADGYRYTITTTGAAGTLYLFDPLFCATANKTSGGGHSGAGDHWLGTPTPVSTYFRLWNMNNQPLVPGAWTLVATDNETNQNQVDKSATYGSTTLSNYSDSGSPSSPADCQSNPKHNAWWSFSGLAANSMYSLQVTTTDPASPAANRSQNFENMFSMAVSGGGTPAIYGSGSMITYANVTSGSSVFYLAQIDRASGAGKTIEIDLFDPGDVGSPSWLQILPPDGSPAYTPIRFSYTSDVGRSNTNTNCMQTYGGTGGSAPAGCGENATSGGNWYQNAWVHIMITLPTTYGDSSDPLTNSGWWKIKYTVAQASDTTTWQVSILGNPVRLVP